MRRTVLVVAIFAVVACGFTSVAAHAASPVTRYGGHCVTVSSNVNGRTGSICAFVDDMGGMLRGEVAFTSNSGTLREVSVTTLQLSVDNQVTTVLHNATKYAVGISWSFTENWWDEPAGLRLHPKQVGAYNACMTWTDGGRACTGSSWLYSLTVQV